MDQHLLKFLRCQVAERFLLFTHQKPALLMFAFLAHIRPEAKLPGLHVILQQCTNHRHYSDSIGSIPVYLC